MGDFDLVEAHYLIEFDTMRASAEALPRQTTEPIANAEKSNRRFWNATRSD